jgi:hypothetical protein
MFRTLIIAAVVVASLQLASNAEARTPHHVMTRLGHGLHHGLHRLGNGLHNLTHPHHRIVYHRH